MSSAQSSSGASSATTKNSPVIVKYKLCSFLFSHATKLEVIPKQGLCFTNNFFTGQLISIKDIFHFFIPLSLSHCSEYFKNVFIPLLFI